MMRRCLWVGPATLGAVLTVACTVGCTGASDTLGDDGEIVSFANGPASAYYPVLFAEVPLEERIQLDRRYQELVATCMHIQGFEFEVWSPMGEGSTLGAPSDAPVMGTLEYAKLYGYGFSTERLMPPEERMSTAPGDPNWAIEDALSGAEATAYRAALGSDPEHWPRNFVGDGSWPTEGCRGNAWEQTFARQPGRSPAGEALAENLMAARTEWAENPEIDVIDREWSACMDKAGFKDIATPAQAVGDLQDGWGGGVEIDESDGLPVDTPQMREHQSEEIALATADYTCREEVRYERRNSELIQAAEQAWVDQHREELDALMLEAGFDVADGKAG